jgi:epoxyqueuosine reductase
MQDNKMLIESGVVIQEPDGTHRVVSPEEAKEYLKSMPMERRKLYESIPDGKSV